MNTGEGSGADDWQERTEETSEEMAKLKANRKKPTKYTDRDMYPLFQIMKY